MLRSIRTRMLMMIPEWTFHHTALTLQSITFIWGIQIENFTTRKTGLTA